MSEIQYAGEYEIEEIRLFSSSGNIIPLNGLMMSLSIFENIFSPTMSGQIVLLDTNSIVLNLPIIGQEYLSFRIKTASLGNESTGIIDYTENVFSIYKIDKRIMGDGAEAIVLHFASPEMLRNSRTRVSKSYTNSIDKIVIDVLQNERYINSKKDLFIEGTVGVRKLIAPSSLPFTFIQKLASEAISTEHGSPYFMFFENKDGIHFRSLDSLYSQPVSAEYNTGKFFHQENSGTVVKDILEEYSRPIGHQIVQANDMLSNVRGGLLGSNLITHDIYKKNYNTKSFRYFKNFPDHSRLSDNPIYNTNVIDEFGNTVDNFTNANIHLHPTSKVEESDAQHYTDVTTTPYSPNRIENSLLHRQAKFLELKKGLSLIVEVHGMTNMAIGQTINFEMLVVGETHGKSKADPYYSGKYLITQLKHQFDEVPQKYHTIAMTIVKDGYSQELEQNTGAAEPKRRSKGTVYTNVA